VYRHPFQVLPDENAASSMLPGSSIHSLDEHYERRLLQVPRYVRGPLLEYTSVVRCSYKDSFEQIKSCLNNYRQETASNLPGVAAIGWEALALMTHSSTTDILVASSTDTDNVYVLKNDDDPNFRRCIIGFQGSDGVSDLANFVGSSQDSTRYCGRDGIHSGVRDELWDITHDLQYQNIIKPALGTCHEVTCVGHSLGGALCNLFTMCANQGLENLDASDGEDMLDDYYSLVWQKPTSEYW
jgi:hypothetical protein